MFEKIIRFFSENRLVVGMLLVLWIGFGIYTAPFNWEDLSFERDPIPVDAIPDIGENQQIVFTRWPGRSPQDVEDQITYPLTTALLGLPGVKTIRSNSMFGVSSIYIIFKEDVEFYWSRSRILEKLNALPANLLPEGVSPALGPDATALGQVFWYTLEGKDTQGNTVPGWDLHELRSIQDYQVRYALMSVEGVAEVASIGGYVKEYQIDLDPLKLQAYDVSIPQVLAAVKNANLDIGAQTLEINRVEYFIRGLGYVKQLEDLQESVVAYRQGVPIRLKEVAYLSLGPATRRGVLDKSGAEVAGGVVVCRYGANPMEVIQRVKEKIAEISPGLPEKELANGTLSKVSIVPFYDRSELIRETIGTLEEALLLEVLVTVLVILVMVRNIRASLLISILLPLAVLGVFAAMKWAEIPANIVSLSGIAIAIGTIVDVGIVLSENLLKKLENSKEGNLLQSIQEAFNEVASAVTTAVITTVISFIPVFALQAAEGKLFSPLAYTKTFALLASLVIALFFLPALTYWVYSIRIPERVKSMRPTLPIGIQRLINSGNKKGFSGKAVKLLPILVIALLFTYYLAESWLPLGAGSSSVLNFFFVAVLVGGLLAFFKGYEKVYPKAIKLCLQYKKTFLLIPFLLTLFGFFIWIGFASVLLPITSLAEKVGWNMKTDPWFVSLNHAFPGVGSEFMPALDEGAFLLMPTSMAHAGMEENIRVLQQLDMAVTAIPEVKEVVGKLGRVESALDPAPISMYENVILYKSEYATNSEGHRIRFKTDEAGRFLRKDAYGEIIPIEKGKEFEAEASELIPDEDGKYFRQWRDEILTPDDIWEEIARVTKLPGVTSAPKLQPIETRLVMLQTGMRAPMGIKVQGPDLATIEAFGKELERLLKEVPSVKAEAVFADRIVGKPYLNIELDRPALARYGLSVKEVQQSIETVIGGVPQTMTVEGRERYAIRVRIARELRDRPEDLQNLLIRTPNGNIPLKKVARLHYQSGPQMIKSEDTFLTGYVLFDKRDGYSEVEVVEAAQNYLSEAIERAELKVPAGVSYRFSGSYENQVRASKRLGILIPVCLMVIFVVLYLQLRSVAVTLMVFFGVSLAFSGGFWLIWLYGTEGFLDIGNLREIFQIDTINLSVAIWVGFIALFGIATDDGVLMGTYLQQSFQKNPTNSIEQIRQAVVEGSQKRIRPALMTSATTILALLPVLTSTGRGADIMVPMAIPSFGGMILAIITTLTVPVLYCWWKEKQLKMEN